MQLALYDAIGDLVKAGRDFQVLQLGLEVLAATLAAQGHAPVSPALEVLRGRLDELA